MSASLPPPIYLAGATGTGKTAIAVALARRLGGEVVNADAFQVYRGLDIVAAIPNTEEQGGIPHHLFGCLDPTERSDAASHARLAEPIIAEIQQRDHHPIVVGGSGLYLKALTHGLAPTPRGDEALRHALEPLGLDELCDWLTHIDPAGAAATNLDNRRYVTRNLEITLLSGRPASELKSHWRDDRPAIIGFHLAREREHLYQRINARTEAMFTAGLEGEIAALGELSSTAERAIGIAQVRALFAGELSRTEAIAAIQQATRRYAKRQATWFRRESELQSICIEQDATPDSVAAELEQRVATCQSDRS